MPWALAYWNVRKTWFQLGRARGRRCPCQNPSDSGRTGETECDAALGWNAAERFRWVCPLLVQRKGRWVCAESAAGVRPFWGRAGLIVGPLLLGLYLSGVSTVWMGLRARGATWAQWSHFAWPGNWDSINAARAGFFVEMADRHLARGEINEAFIALATARKLGASDFRTSFLLAVMAGHRGEAAYAEAQFIALMKDFPAERERVAMAFHDYLLTSFQFDALAAFCRDQLVTQAGAAPAWIHSLLYVEELRGNVAQFRLATGDAWERLPAGVRQVLLAMELAQSGRLEEAKLKLKETRPSLREAEDVVLVRHRLRMWRELGAFAEAFGELSWARQVQPSFEWTAQAHLLLWARDQTLSEWAFEGILPEKLTQPVIDRLCAIVLDTRDGASLVRLARAVQQSEWRDDPSVAASLWVSALVCARDDVAESLSTGVRGVFPGKISSKEFVRLLHTAGGMRFALGVLPLGRESVHALVREVAEQNAATKLAKNSLGAVPGER